MEFPEDDLQFIACPCGHPTYPDIPVLGCELVRDASGNDKVMRVIELEATVLDGNEQRMTLWTRTHTCLNRSRGKKEMDKIRLDGPLFRSLLFSATVPDRRRNLYVTTDYWQFLFLPRGLAAEDRKALPLPPWLDRSDRGSFRVTPRDFTPLELAKGPRPAPVRAWGAPPSPPKKG